MNIYIIFFWFCIYRSIDMMYCDYKHVRMGILKPYTQTMFYFVFNLSCSIWFEYVRKAYHVNISIVGEWVRRKLKKDRCDRSSPTGKDAKPEEYDINMHRTDVYDDIRCAVD